MSRFIAGNRKLSSRLYKLFPQGKDDIFKEYVNTISKLTDNKSIECIVDVGAGKQCPYVKTKKDNLTIIGVDISYEELKYNKDIDQKIVCDITKEIPLPTESSNLITSSSVIEHLKDTEGFIINAQKVLKPDGYFVALIPCKFAIFSIINQLLPKKVSRFLLDKFSTNPDILGFEAFYDRCYCTAIEKMLKNHGFKIVETSISYRSSDYFSFFVPIFILSALYELAIKTLRLKNLSSYVLIVAQKK